MNRVKLEVECENKDVAQQVSRMVGQVMEEVMVAYKGRVNATITTTIQNLPDRELERLIDNG